MNILLVLAICLSQAAGPSQFTIENPMIDCSEQRQKARTEIWAKWESKKTFQVQLISSPKDGPDIVTNIEMKYVNRLFETTCKQTYKERVWVGQQDHWENKVLEFKINKIIKFTTEGHIEKLRFIGAKGEMLFIL